MANLTYRVPSPAAPASTTFKNAPLLNSEIDGNIKSLDDSKYEKTGGTISGNVTITGSLTISTNSAAVNSADDTTTAATMYPALFIATKGNANDSLLKTSSTKLYFNPSTGTLSSTNFDSLSDARYKTEINKISGALEKIKSISGYTYMLLPTDDHQDPKVYAGVMAQEVVTAMPEVVNGSEDTKYSVQYGNMIAFLIEAVKELDEKIDALTAAKKRKSKVEPE